MLEIIFGLLLNWAEATELDTLFVTPQRMEHQMSPSGSFYSREKMKTKNTMTVSEYLSELPGVSVYSQGGVGQGKTVFLRGGKSEHILVIVDGIRATDPSTPARSFDWGQMDMGDVESIEVLYGAESVIYGSDALNGVIVITTQSQSLKNQKQGRFLVGSYGTRRYQYQQQDRPSLKWDSFFQLSRIESDGISSAHKKYGNTEQDGYHKNQLQGRVGLNLSDYTRLNWYNSFHFSDLELDDGGGPLKDDPNFTRKDQEGKTHLSLQNFSLSGDWAQQADVYYYQNQRKFLDSDEPLSDYQTQGDLLGVQWKGQWERSHHQQWYLGGEWLEERMKSEQLTQRDEYQAHRWGVFTYYKASWYQWGLRWDSPQDIEKVMTYKMSLTPEWKTWQYFVHWGTAYKAPSLYQLYNVDYGNSDLKSEKSEKWELGFQKEITQKQLLRLSGFYNEFSDLILWQTRYYNVDRAETSGLQADYKWGLSPLWNTQLGYTYLEGKNLTQKQALLRNPRHQIQWDWEYNQDPILMVLSTHYRGNQWDELNGVRQKRDPQWQQNFYFKQTLNPHWAHQLKVENLWNSDNESTLGYGDPGRSLYWEWIWTGM